MELESLRECLSDERVIRENHFDIAKSLVHAYNNTDSQSVSSVQELVLRALDKYEAFGASKSVVDSLVRELRLFPYLAEKDLSFRDTLALYTHEADVRKDNLFFHGPQAEVYYKLMKGESVILSAPTSFGKSLIVDAVIASEKFDDIVIVVPTIALIDETRRRLSKFSDSYKVVTHSSQELGSRNIYVLTQERVLEEGFIDNVDFFVIDEFYKLSPNNLDESRCAQLNEAFYRLYKKCSHFYMLGPNVEGVSTNLMDNVSFNFIKYDYKTVVTEFHNRTNEPPEKALEELARNIEGQTIVFCSSPNSARKVTELLIGDEREASNEAIKLAEWLEKEYHEGWILCKALRSGIGIHHARIPRSVSQYIVDLFNGGKINYLVCTSTLIEGVNTSARNIICFDNKINKKKYDFFTFSNIAGRSGRMCQHLIGHVYVLRSAPQEELAFVDIPAISQSENSPTSLLVNLDDSDLSQESRTKIKDIVDQPYLELEIIRRHKSISPETQIEIAKSLYNRVHPVEALVWGSKFPTWDELLFVCELIWEHFNGRRVANGSVVSARQLAYRILELRDKKVISEIVESTIESQAERHGVESVNVDTIISRINDFRRLWANFHFPRMLVCIQDIANEVLGELKLEGECDFEAFASSVENLFYPSSIMALEEYGLPLEIGSCLEGEEEVERGLDSAIAYLKPLKNEIENTPEEELSMDMLFVKRTLQGL